MQPQLLTSEADLVERLRRPADRENAFQEVVKAYGPLLFHHLMRMLGERSDVDDVMQNTMIKAFQNLDRFRGDSQLSTWLYRIATNEALSHLRKNKRRLARLTSTDDIAAAAHHLRAESYFDGDEAQAALIVAMDTLADKQRSVFSMRYFSDLPYQEISKITGTSVGSLKATYHHAVKKIESSLKAYANAR